MPGFDGTGPGGMGAMTGGGRGFCAVTPTMRRPFAPRWNSGYYPAGGSPDVDWLQEELRAIKATLVELETKIQTMTENQKR